MTSDSKSSAPTREARREAAPSVVLVISLQLLLSILSEEKGWKLWFLPWWAWLVIIGPEAALVLMLGIGMPNQHVRKATLALVALMSFINALLLTALIGSIVGGHEQDGGQLLLKGITVWATNVTAFALTFWEVDRHWPPEYDFQFPQMENPKFAEGGENWQPRLLDFFYVSFTNSIAFSPTDAMPLTRKAKVLMLTESAVSAVAILLVAARAVNIFN